MDIYCSNGYISQLSESFHRKWLMYIILIKCTYFLIVSDTLILEDDVLIVFLKCTYFFMQCRMILVNGKLKLKVWPIYGKWQIYIMHFSVNYFYLFFLFIRTFPSSFFSDIGFPFLESFIKFCLWQTWSHQHRLAQVHFSPLLLLFIPHLFNFLFNFFVIYSFNFLLIVMEKNDFIYYIYDKMI